LGDLKRLKKLLIYKLSSKQLDPRIDYLNFLIRYGDYEFLQEQPCKGGKKRKRSI